MWQDVSTNTLVYDTPDFARITQAIPSAKHLYNGYVAVPNNLFNLQMLVWLGFPVPPPMFDNYDWPRSRKLELKPLMFRAQVLTANFLALRPRALTLSQMRTGKTLALLWAADYLMSQYPRGTFRFVITSPLSALQRVWGDAIFLHLMNRRTYTIVHGTASKRQKLLAEPHDFYIINPDGLSTGVILDGRRIALRGFASDLAQRTDIRGFIVDEISAFRNGSTERNKVARYWLQQRDVVWGASGSPTPNAPTDAWGIAKLINNAGGETFTSFKSRTMFRLSQFDWVPAKGSAQAARAMLAPSIRFTQADVGINLQEDVDPRSIELSPAQHKAMAELRRDAVLVLENGNKIAPANEAVLRNKLIQIVCGAVYSGSGADRQTHKLDCAPRLAALHDLLEEAGCKVIICASLTSVVTLLYENLHHWKGRGIITGATTPKQRNLLFQQFQENPLSGPLIVDPGTIQMGLDLSAARVICWFGPTDRAEVYSQANERIRGPNQKATSTTVVQFISTPIERDIFHRIARRQSLQGVMLGLVKDDGHGIHG